MHYNGQTEAMQSIAYVVGRTARVTFRIIFSPALKHNATTDMLLRLATSDPVITEELAERLHDFIGCSADLIEAGLAVHAAPKEWHFLARNCEVSLRTLMLLVQDAVRTFPSPRDGTPKDGPADQRLSGHPFLMTA